MDTLSHGLWGGIAFGRKSRKLFWQSFAFGVVPDILSFGIFFVLTFLGFASRPNWASGPPPADAIPSYIYTLYDLTHSLVIFAVVFLVVWLLLRKPVYTMLAWPLHILVDIPTHSLQFFPTPFLWPLFDGIRVDGIPWSHPYIFIPNVVFLAVLYFWFYWKSKKERI